MKYAYKEQNFQERTWVVINRAIEILEFEYGRGYVLTLRQLYYKFVKNNWLENCKQSYDRLGSIMNDARLAGLVDWDWMEDRTRNLMGVPTFGSPSEAIESVVKRYAIDLWDRQEARVEVWVEKDALIDVIRQACVPLRVDFFSCRGYTSQSEMRSAGVRLMDYASRGQTPVIIHAGDLDPSGVDMSRDIEERLRLFMEEEGYMLSFERVALNPDQIERFQLPPNWAKLTDGRAKKYVEEYGDKSWELDALDSEDLREMVTNAVLAWRDEDYWQDSLDEEKADIEAMKKAQAKLK